MNPIQNVWMPMAAIALAYGAVTADAKASVEVKGDQAQLLSDKAALQRFERQNRIDEAKLKADKASGNVAAQSRDSEMLSKDRQAVNSEKKVVADDKPDSQKLKTDRVALQREEKQWMADAATLKADKASGRMAAVSPDSEKVYQDNRYIKGESKDIAADEAKLKADRRK